MRIQGNQHRGWSLCQRTRRGRLTLLQKSSFFLFRLWQQAKPSCSSPPAKPVARCLCDTSGRSHHHPTTRVQHHLRKYHHPHSPASFDSNECYSSDWLLLASVPRSQPAGRVLGRMLPVTIHLHIISKHHHSYTTSQARRFPCCSSPLLYSTLARLGA